MILRYVSFRVVVSNGGRPISKAYLCSEHHCFKPGETDRHREMDTDTNSERHRERERERDREREGDTDRQTNRQRSRVSGINITVWFNKTLKHT